MADQRKKRVLIVEDDMLLSLVEERLVEQLGYLVAGKATSGEEAIAKLQECTPDLILMDIMLNGELDGIQTMEKIRSISDVPVIYLSGNADRFIYERAKKTGFTDFLIKPISLSELKKPVEKAFRNGRESARQSYYYSENYSSGSSLGKTA